MIHKAKYEHAGKTVQIIAGQFKGEEYRLEDYWDRISPEPWGMSDGNPACIEYAIRTSTEGVPADDEVVYGKVGNLGKLMHVTQLGVVIDGTVKDRQD